jgi:phosphoribosylformylglycinamidine synthase
MFRATVKVRLKNGISDPEGRNVAKALHLLGFEEVKQVTMVAVNEVELDCQDEEIARRRVDDMCQRLLTNPVIHDYSIDIEVI